MLMICSVLIAMCTVLKATSPQTIAAAIAVAGIAAVLCLIVTGLSIRDLVKSCKQDNTQPSTSVADPSLNGGGDMAATLPSQTSDRVYAGIS